MIWVWVFWHMADAFHWSCFISSDQLDDQLIVQALTILLCDFIETQSFCFQVVFDSVCRSVEAQLWCVAALLGT